MRKNKNTSVLEWRKNYNKLSIICKISDDCFKAENYKGIIEELKKHKVKGVRLFYERHTIGQVNDDFITCTHAVLVRFKAYKKPRFIK